MKISLLLSNFGKYPHLHAFSFLFMFDFVFTGKEISRQFYIIIPVYNSSVLTTVELFEKNRVFLEKSIRC